MSIAKKTGLYIAPVNQPIIDRVQQEHGFTKISNVINYIITEYDKLTKEQNKAPTQVVEEEVPKTADFSGWFVAEDKQ